MLARKGRLDQDALGLKYLNAPEVHETEVLYWRAFWELCSCRAYPAAPIAWTHIRLWAEANGLTSQEEHELAYLCRHLDLVYLPHLERQLQLRRDREMDAYAKRHGIR